ncbi:MAG: EAL domain-containing protein [Thiomonas sp.]
MRAGVHAAHIDGTEALLRLRDADGVHSAGAFESLLDDEQRSVPLGRLVLSSAACDQAQRWHAQGQRIQISVDISPRHFLDPQFLSDLRPALEKHPRCPPERLVLEVTEHGAALGSAQSPEFNTICCHAAADALNP